jgi:hypothetical protein
MDEVLATRDAAAADFGRKVAGRRCARLADGDRLRVRLEES